jgi:SAM-dependent methyltransferase
MIEAAIRAVLEESHREADRRAHWDAVYSTKAPDQVSWYQARPEISLGLIERAGKGRGARLVDVGGGASRLVDLLLDAGLNRLTVLDLSEVALEKARARLGSRASLVDWVVADATRWRPPGTFDVWHDRAVFHFLVDSEQRHRYLATISAALSPGAQAVMGTFASDGPERCSGLPVARYEPESLAQELGPGFRLVENLHEEHRTPSGKMQRFQFSRLLRL